MGNQGTVDYKKTAFPDVGIILKDGILMGSNSKETNEKLQFNISKSHYNSQSKETAKEWMKVPSSSSHDVHMVKKRKMANRQATKR